MSKRSGIGDVYHAPTTATPATDCEYYDKKRADKRRKKIREALAAERSGVGGSGDVVFADEAVSARELGDEDGAGPNFALWWLDNGNPRDEGADCAQWWLDHGISPEVREARPYERWRADDPDSLAAVRQAHIHGRSLRG